MPQSNLCLGREVPKFNKNWFSLSTLELRGGIREHHSISAPSKMAHGNQGTYWVIAMQIMEPPQDCPNIRGR